MYQLNDPTPNPHELIEVAIELTSKAHIECDNTGYLFPLHRKLAILTIPRCQYSLKTIWTALIQQGYHPPQWNIQNYYEREKDNPADFWTAHNLTLLTPHASENLVLCKNKITNQYEVWTDDGNPINVCVADTVDDAVLGSGTHWNDWLPF